MLLENADVRKDTIDKILSKVKNYFDSGVEEFDDNVDDVNFWCDGDNDKVVFMSTGDSDSFATITYEDIKNNKDMEIKAYLDRQFKESFD